ncbi:MAG TPA: hypothetical protein VHV47_07005 [Opitutaceae bacterium]|nr:hypothetical protein [Opitutaceae bacterium]
METVEPADEKDEKKLHVSTLLIASERALNNALDQLGFAENDDRVIEHEGQLAFITCSHDSDCDDLFALISELAARGESWELQFRIDTEEGRAVFQRLSRHARVEAVNAELPPETDNPSDLPVHDLDKDSGRVALKKLLKRVDPAASFATVASTQSGRATATIFRRTPRQALAMAQAADEASLRTAIRELLPNIMFSVTMMPPAGA